MHIATYDKSFTYHVSLYLIYVLKFSLVFFFFPALMGVAELAKGIQYDKPIKTG